jgi:tryptophan synthase alpha chain
MSVAFGAGALIRATFARCRHERRAALIPFLVGGDPDPLQSRERMLAASAGGGDIIEVGFGYSDPVADGPVIASASQRALAAGMTFERTLELVRQLKSRLATTPLVAFAYYNLLFAYGVEHAAQACAAAGFSGILAPDLPLEEADDLLAACARLGLAVPLLVAPTTPPNRAAQIARAATGFVYLVSRMGVTGHERAADEDACERVRSLRQHTETPIVIGFGLSPGPRLARVAACADGIVVGSLLVERAGQAPNPLAAIEEIRMTCETLAAYCKPAPGPAGVNAVRGGGPAPSHGRSVMPGGSP